MSSSPPSSSGRRKSKAGLFPWSPTNPSATGSQGSSPPRTAKKKSTASRFSAAFSPSPASSNRSESPLLSPVPPISTTARPRPVSAQYSASLLDSESPQSSRPSLAKRNRPSSIFGSLKSLRFGDDDDTPPLTATSASSRAQSFMWKEFGGDPVELGNSRLVLHHGEAQISSGWFWKKKEYLVLTERHLIRYKSRAKANEAFPNIPLVSNRHDLHRHSSSHSIDSVPDQQSFQSDASGEKAAGIPLECVVAAYLVDETRLVHALELCYLDPETVQSSSITLQFSDSDERDLWLRGIREASNNVRLLDLDPLPRKFAEYVSRVVEREQDYDREKIKIYKIVKRSGSKNTGRYSTDETVKAAPTILFLVIGLNKIHLIPLPKHIQRGSTSSLGELSDGGSFGILTLTWISVASQDDSFSMAFRFPLQPPRSFYFASLAAPEIAREIRRQEMFLRPEWINRPFHFSLSSATEDETIGDLDEYSEDLNCFDRTLTAFCVSYGVSASNIRYSVEDNSEDAPRFNLLPPSNRKRPGYTVLEVLAVLRSLRYNEHFGSISFAHVNMDCLNGVRDYHGLEYICYHNRAGIPIQVHIEEQEAASLLINEVRAIAISSRTLRRLDFSYSMPNARGIGLSLASALASCDVLEALYPVCRDQSTNVDWLCFNGLPLTEVDLDYLITIATHRTCHLRAIEVSDCGLRDSSISLLLDSLKAQSETIESIDISRNPAKLVPYFFHTQMEAFGYIRKLNLSDMMLDQTSGSFLTLEVLSKWRLEELRLSGVILNDQSVDSICRYVASPKSTLLRELALANCSLDGGHVLKLMRSLSTDTNAVRFLHLDISDNNLQQNHEGIVRAIAQNLAPSHLSLRSIEYDDDHVFAELIFSLAQNKSIRYLDLAKASLPGQASEETCVALEELFMNNSTLEELDISGENSRLEITKLGSGFIQALRGLRKNKVLQTLKIQYQNLGLKGASALADVLRENKTLRYLHCDCNAITLTGFTDLVNALAFNKAILFLPSQDDGRQEQLQQTTQQIKLAREKADGPAIAAQTSKLSGVMRTFAKIGSGDISAGKTAPVPQWSEQDVQAALRLIDEGWGEQVVRLQAFLARNSKLAAGLPLDEGEGDEPVSDEELQRPGTAGSLSRIMEKVAIESTPTIEKFVELGAPAASASASSPSASTAAPSAWASAAASQGSSASSYLSASSNILSAVEIDTTPMFERDDPFSFGGSSGGGGGGRATQGVAGGLPREAFMVPLGVVGDGPKMDLKLPDPKPRDQAGSTS